VVKKCIEKEKLTGQKRAKRPAGQKRPERIKENPESTKKIKFVL
jgi:hypothetical protein